MALSKGERKSGGKGGISARLSCASPQRAECRRRRRRGEAAPRSREEQKDRTAPRTPPDWESAAANRRRVQGTRGGAPPWIGRSAVVGLGGVVRTKIPAPPTPLDVLVAACSTSTNRIWFTQL